MQDITMDRFTVPEFLLISNNTNSETNYVSLLSNIYSISNTFNFIQTRRQHKGPGASTSLS